jgi:hypothetical protein
VKRKPSKLTATVEKAAKAVATPRTPWLARCRDWIITFLCAGGFIATKRDGHWEIGDVTILLAIVGGCMTLAHSTPVGSIPKPPSPPAPEETA